MGRKIRIGVDFDGVVSYNPFRVIRAPIKWVKKKIWKKTKLSFFVPKNRWQKIMWAIVHESSLVPNEGIRELMKMANEEKIELHLITGRFGFLEPNLRKFLHKYGLENKWSSVNINHQAKQPHLFKEEMIKKLKLDLYVEDNWDIVDYLQGNSKTEVWWVFNILDRKNPYTKKGKDLRHIVNQLKESGKL